jgi:exodeoxyribonuclease VII large subunit
LSNLSFPSSGHLYFTLKDANAQIRCAFFRNQQRGSGFKAENGKQVIVKASVSLYEPRGDYQLIVESMEQAGEGDLLRAFELLKQKLASEGLFNSEHKKQLPTLPKSIGVITSATGAAISDILTVLKRRFAAIPVVIYPVAVQGEASKHEIVKALATANQQKYCDVLILGRGGGSLEDLWAFNEEIVARAIFASEIPVISAVGHETDVSIADFVADLRAPTPSVAAEYAVPELQHWLSRFVYLENRLDFFMQDKLKRQRQTVSYLDRRLQQQHPGQRLKRNAQRIDELELRLQQILKTRLRYYNSLIETRTAIFWQHNPGIMIQNHRLQQIQLQKRLLLAMQHKIETLKQKTLSSSQTLHAVSPLATLGRGYALAFKPESLQIIRSVKQLVQGELIETRFAEGSISSRIESIND